MATITTTTETITQQSWTGETTSREVESITITGTVTALEQGYGPEARIVVLDGDLRIADACTLVIPQVGETVTYVKARAGRPGMVTAYRARTQADIDANSALKGGRA